MKGHARQTSSVDLHSGWKQGQGYQPRGMPRHRQSGTMMFFCSLDLGGEPRRGTALGDPIEVGALKNALG